MRRTIRVRWTFGVAVLVVLLAFVGLAGCVNAGPTGRDPSALGAGRATSVGDSTGDLASPAPAPKMPAGLDVPPAYYQAAVYGRSPVPVADYNPPFDVYYPTYLPEGFALESARWIGAGGEAYVPGTDTSQGLDVLYRRGEASIRVRIAVGDIGEDKPEMSLPWGEEGMRADVYEDGEGGYFVDGPQISRSDQGGYHQLVDADGVTLATLKEFLAGMKLLEW